MRDKYLPEKEKSIPSPKRLVEGIDFYIENGYYVFTAFFLKNRGTCCKNKCRHCPYQQPKA
jgi:Family of unknown function (DUF5522)